MTGFQRLRKLRHPAYALAAGFLAALGFPPVANLIPLIASTTILILMLRRNENLGRPLRCDAALGLTFGLGFFGTLLWWLNVISGEAYVAVVAAESLFVAAAFVCMRLVIRFRFWPLWTAVVWVAIEYVRSIVPFGGLPWGRWAYATVDTPFEAYARIAGLPATSGVVFLTGSLVALALSTNLRSAWKPAILVAALALAGLALPTGVAGAGATKRVALVPGKRASPLRAMACWRNPGQTPC